MQDQRAPRQSLLRGIPGEQKPGTLNDNRGILREEWRGQSALTEERQAELEATQGIPHTGPGMASHKIRERVGAPKCVALTKKGLPCKAFATTGDVLCTGHLKTVDKG